MMVSSAIDAKVCFSLVEIQKTTSNQMNSLCDSETHLLVKLGEGVSKLNLRTTIFAICVDMEFISNLFFTKVNPLLNESWARKILLFISILWNGNLSWILLNSPDLAEILSTCFIINSNLWAVMCSNCLSATVEQSGSAHLIYLPNHGTDHMVCKNL